MISGSCYDKENIIEYDNWITGKGGNVYNNFTLFVYSEKYAYKIKTISEYLALENYQPEDEIDYSLYHFKAIVFKKYEDYYLGIMLFDENRTKTILLMDMKLIDSDK